MVHSHPRPYSQTTRSGPVGMAVGYQGDQAELAGPGDGLGAVRRAELAQQTTDVLFHRVQADHQLLGDAWGSVCQRPAAPGFPAPGRSAALPDLALPWRRLGWRLARRGRHMLASAGPGSPAGR